MNYTIKDLSEGKCAVINDGTLEELKEVLKLAFPKGFVVIGISKYYFMNLDKFDDWYACGYTQLPTQSVKDFLVNDSSDYKVELKGFPKEVVEKMLDYQVEQGNVRDVTVFENQKNKTWLPEAEGRGFCWDLTKEGFDFWYQVISKKDFKVFFDKYPKTTHSWKDYKKGDYVVVTEYRRRTSWRHWFMPGEVLKLGGEEWDGSIKNHFGAYTNNYKNGGGMIRSFEENYKIRKATQEEIDNSQWGNKIIVDIESSDNIEIHKKMKYLPSIHDIEIKPLELKVKLRNKRIRIKL